MSDDLQAMTRAELVDVFDNTRAKILDILQADAGGGLETLVMHGEQLDLLEQHATDIKAMIHALDEATKPIERAMRDTGPGTLPHIMGMEVVADPNVPRDTMLLFDSKGKVVKAKL